MRSGFAHFDASHRENFCAAVLLLAMEVDDAVRDYVAHVVCTKLDISASSVLLDFGREARLADTDDENYARVDLWLRFDSANGPFYAFIEVKTHDRWDAAHVVDQVRDQAERTLARGHREIRGAMLLGPGRLCQRVHALDASIRSLTWPRLLQDLRALRSPSRLTSLAIRHLEENMDRSIGFERELSLSDFEQATTIVSCLRHFLLGCIADVGGRVRGDQLYMTPGDGQPLRGSGWAWHGLAIPFALDDQKGRLGLYKYAETPTGEESNQSTLWIEAYVGDSDGPIASAPFAPTTLRPAELDAARAVFTAEWRRKLDARSESAESPA